ncbi:MAG TPA: M1 family metallopeptidase [Kofleriaceae bacterium]|nr:M1 family metallopeptidase [Kofleriaceae bacterium]
MPRPVVVVAVIVAGALSLAACGDHLGPPHHRPAPAIDPFPALRLPGPHTARAASYAIDAAYDATAHTLRGREVLTWKNTGDSAVTALPFHLYLNGFKNETTTFFRSTGGVHRGNRAGAWGWIEVTSIKLGGAELRPTAHYLGPDETVLEVPLPQPLAGGDTVQLELAFDEQLPEVYSRTGYKGAFTMVAQWFPKVGVRVGAPGFETWECPTFHGATEFFADFGTYDVRLTVPDTHVVAATGVLTATHDNGDGTRLYTYRAEDVHDFVWMIDPYMEVLTGTAHVDGGTVEVRVYHRPRQLAFARRHLAAGIGAIEELSRMLVPYPWPVMTIVDPPPEARGAAGMEYPTLVVTGADSVLFRPGIRVPEYVTIHEVAHNWFQGVLASNEFEEAWMDEGVNEWIDGVIMAHLYGEKQSAIDWMGWQAETFRMRKALASPLGELPSPIATAAYAYSDLDAYAGTTYDKTMQALRTLENVVGRDRFAAAMQAYAKAWEWKHPTGNDFFASLQASLGEDLGWFVRPAFYGTGAVDFALRSARCEPQHQPRGVFGEGANRRTAGSDDNPDTGTWTCDVIVVNTGTIAVPVDVELTFADGSHQRIRWNDPGGWDARDGSHWHRYELLRSSPVTEIDIDPDGKVLLADHVTDDHVRLDQNTRASWRAGSRVGFWAQTAMQVVGL